MDDTGSRATRGSFPREDAAGTARRSPDEDLDGAAQADRLAETRHAIRASLTNLALYVDLLNSGPPDRRDHYSEVISQELARLSDLVDRCVHAPPEVPG